MLLGAIVLLGVLIFAVGWALIFMSRPIAVLSPDSSEFPTAQIMVDDWNIRFHQSGAGPHIILLHGLGANLYCWRALSAFLKSQFTVTALDLPGFGGSSKHAHADYGLDDQCARLLAIMNQMGIQRSYIVGSSMGGNIALWFAKNHPDRVLGLCVIAPAVSARLIPIGFRRWAWMSKPVSLALNRRWMRWAHDLTVSKPELVDQERIEETFRTYGRQSDAVRAFMLATEAIRDARLNQSLVELQTPTLILWGSRDKLVNRRIIDDLETALVKAESQVHLGGGHHLQEDEPEWVAEKLVAFFLNSHD